MRININSKYFYFLLFSTLFSSLTVYSIYIQGDSILPAIPNLFLSVSIASLAIPIRGVYLKIFKCTDIFYHILILSLFSNVFIFNTLIIGFNMAVLSGILLVWSLYFYEIKNWKLFILALPLALLGMEAPIIWGIFLTLYFFLRSDFKTSIFIAITSIIVTTLSLDGRVGNNLEYMELGRNSSEVLETIRNQPTKLLEILFREYFVQNYFDFLAKFPITAINPSSWLLVLPNFAERFLSINLASWSNSTYYGFILAPVAIYISILSLYKVKQGIKSENIYKLLAISLLIPSLIFSLVQLSTSPNSKLKDILTQDNIEVVSEVNK